MIFPKNQTVIAKALAAVLSLGLLLTGCSAAAITPSENQPETEAPSTTTEGGLVTEQVLDSAEGEIHYSYFLPQPYDASRTYPLVMTMPGYDMMWFGENSSGSNLNWNGFSKWTELDEEMIVVSAQLTDWGEKSARQAIELTEYVLSSFPVDPSRVYAAGYSAGGETMSRAVSMRPDLFAAYLHGASQWDGTYSPLAEHQVAVYIFMGENDEYYGSQKARDAYNGLLTAYREAGLTDAEIDTLLQLNIPDNAWFNSQGIYNYHGGGNVVFNDQEILEWIIQHRKEAQPSAAGFTDVDADAWYAGAVAYVTEHGLMDGASGSAFSPDENAPRGVVVIALYRAAESPEVSGGTAFPDVSGEELTAAAAWAAQNGIIGGYENGNFGPDDSITREQIAAMLWRGEGSPAASRATFTDTDSISAYAAAVTWTQNEEIINGVGGNRFDPSGTVTRAQLSQILMNYLERDTTPAPTPSTPELPDYAEGALSIAGQGMFSSGGTVTEPVEGEYNSAMNWLDAARPGNTAHVDHANVLYQIPEASTGNPIVYLHGYGQSRMGWMTTPDGREGWSSIFLRYGHAAFLVDQPRRGEAGSTATMTEDGFLDAWAADSKDYKPGDQAWYTHFRIGRVAPNRYTGSQFPEGADAQDQFFRQMTPNTGNFDQAVAAAALGEVMADVKEMTGEKSIFITHSQGGAVGWDVPVDNVTAIVAIEPGGTPMPGSGQYNALLEADVPIIIYFGDYIDNGPADIMSTGFWRGVRDGAIAFAEQYNADGGDATVINLPSIGIIGNSHFMFQELNNKEIADHIEAWLMSHGLA